MQDSGSLWEVPGEERAKRGPPRGMAYVRRPGLSKSGLNLGQTDARDLSR